MGRGDGDGEALTKPPWNVSSEGKLERRYGIHIIVVYLWYTCGILVVVVQ